MRSALLLAAAGLVTLTACRKDTSDSGLDPYCLTLDAPEDFVAQAGGEVSLSAGASGAGEGCLTHGEVRFDWALVAAPGSSELSQSALGEAAQASELSFTPDVLGIYVFSLEVCDEVDCVGPELVEVRVEGGPAPVVHAGEDAQTCEDVRVEFSAQASVEPVEWRWTLSSAPSCSQLERDDLYNVGTSMASLVPDCPGEYVVQVEIFDGWAWSAPDFVVASVLDACSCEGGPIADAGDFAVACLSAPASLNGWGSYSTCGGDLSYRWTLMSVPEGSATTQAQLSNPSVGAPTLRWDVAGDYELQLEVAVDDGPWSVPDVVVITADGGC